MENRIRALSLNTFCCIDEEMMGGEGMPAVTRNRADQIRVMQEQEADVHLLQEMLLCHMDQYTTAMGGQPPAMGPMRHFRDRKTTQMVVVLARHPIDGSTSKSFGYMHANGHEAVATLQAQGQECQAVATMAVVSHPSGPFMAITAHMSWCPKASDGLFIHQLAALEGLSQFLEGFQEWDLPVIFGADFNAINSNRQNQVVGYIPPYLTSAISDEQKEEWGTSMDLDNEETMERFKGYGVFVDGLFYSHEKLKLVEPVRMIRGISDHAGFVADFERI